MLACINPLNKVEIRFSNIITNETGMDTVAWPGQLDPSTAFTMDDIRNLIDRGLNPLKFGKEKLAYLKKLSKQPLAFFDTASSVCLETECRKRGLLDKSSRKYASKILRLILLEKESNVFQMRWVCELYDISISVSLLGDRTIEQATRLMNRVLWEKIRKKPIISPIGNLLLGSLPFFEHTVCQGVLLSSQLTIRDTAIYWREFHPLQKTISKDSTLENRYIITVTMVRSLEPDWYGESQDATGDTHVQSTGTSDSGLCSLPETSEPEITEEEPELFYSLS